MGWRILYVRSWQDPTHTRAHTHTKMIYLKFLTVAKNYFPYRPSHTHTLSVRPILIGIVSDNDLVNGVRRALDKRLMQLMVISGWSCQWCSNKVNISWDPPLRRGWASRVIFAVCAFACESKRSIYAIRLTAISDKASFSEWWFSCTARQITTFNSNRRSLISLPNTHHT